MEGKLFGKINLVKEEETQSDLNYWNFCFNDEKLKRE